MSTSQVLYPNLAQPIGLPVADHEMLAQAFTTFTAASSSLQAGYALLQSEVARLRQELEVANRMSAILAHEIRNPLGSLELFAELLANSELASEQKSCVAHMQAGVRTLAATVNNVLHLYSQPPAGLAAQPRATDLGELLRWLSGYLRPVAQQAEVSVQLAIPPGPIWITADRHGLEQVILNMALNAIRSMQNGGVLSLVAGESSDATIWIEVADTGQGIAADTLPQIFQPAFSTVEGSPGLGLAVCKTVVERHNGQIRVTSRPGQGTTFRVEIPSTVEQP